MYTNSRRTTKSTVPKSVSNIEIAITIILILFYVLRFQALIPCLKGGKFFLEIILV